MLPVSMPAQLAARFGQCREGLESAMKNCEQAKETGADLEADMVNWRWSMTNISSIRQSLTLAYIGDRYAVFTDPARILRGGYHEESLWTTPPSWSPGAPVLGYESAMFVRVRIYKSFDWRFDWRDPIPADCRPAMARLRQVLAALDDNPPDIRRALLRAWRLLRDTELYCVRNKTHQAPDADNYRFSSLAEGGPLSESEHAVVGGLLRTYCSVAIDRPRTEFDDHPYVALRRAHDEAQVRLWTGQIRIFQEEMAALEEEWKVVQRNLRVERKRAILASGLAFQDELADVLGANGYPCTGLPRKDRGIDLLTRRNGGIRIGIQAKKHAKPIGAAAVRALRGAREVHRLDVVAMVSTSGFTRDAWIEARIPPTVALTSLDDLLERIDIGQDALFPAGRPTFRA